MKVKSDGIQCERQKKTVVSAASKFYGFTSWNQKIIDWGKMVCIHEYIVFTKLFICIFLFIKMHMIFTVKYQNDPNLTCPAKLKYEWLVRPTGVDFVEVATYAT